MKKKFYYSQLRLFWLILGLLMLSAFRACQGSLEPTASSLTPTTIATLTSTPVPTDVVVTSLPTPIFVYTRPPEAATSLLADELKQRWLINPPCQPPCWEGVIPGETSAIEAAEILSANPLFTKVEIIKFPLGNTGFVNFEWNGQYHRGGNALFDYASPDQIIYMLRPDLPEIRLGELIEAYGEPSHVMAKKAPAIDIGGPDVWSVDIVWFSRGILVHTGGFLEPRIDENLSLKGITYFPPSWVGSEKTYFPLPDKVKPWQGYGDFDLYAIPTPTPSP